MGVALVIFKGGGWQLWNYSDSNPPMEAITEDGIKFTFPAIPDTLQEMDDVRVIVFDDSNPSPFDFSAEDIGKQVRKYIEEHNQ